MNKPGSTGHSKPNIGHRPNASRSAAPAYSSSQAGTPYRGAASKWLATSSENTCEATNVISYALIGAGGSGTHLLTPMAKYLTTFHGTEPWRLGVFDGDTVEPKNLERQLFADHAVTMNKAEAVVAALGDLHVTAIPEYLSGDNIARYLQDGTIVLIAVDNYPARALIERHMATLANGVVINLGNEESTGSCQVWIRRDGKNVTPPISFLHDEILSGGNDRAEMSCAQIALIPGGEQLIIANMASALYGLTALHLYHQASEEYWTELHFDLMAGKTYAVDMRPRRGWQDQVMA